MESNTSNNYIYQPYYSESDSLCYDQMNKREAKAMNRSSKWKLPINQQEINQFYSHYKNFIDAAKEYQARVLGYVPYEPPETLIDYECETPPFQYAASNQNYNIVKKDKSN